MASVLMERPLSVSPCPRRLNMCSGYHDQMVFIMSGDVFNKFSSPCRTYGPWRAARSRPSATSNLL
eukprot:7203553-Pyramimonas_sp.AAC.1